MRHIPQGAREWRCVSADAEEKQIASVTKFVSEKHALLPPNIIVHFGKTVTWQPLPSPTVGTDGRAITLTRPRDCELVVLSIPLAYASLELIDGQHRLYGFVQADPTTRENFNLVVLGISGLSFETRRETFVAINDRSRRMDPNLVAYLRYTDDEDACHRHTELMAIKIAVELNRSTPFQGKIRLLDVGDQKITLKGVSGYDLKGLLGRRGLLRRHYPNESKEYIGALRLYFGVLKSLFEDEWQHPEEYIIFTNRGISAFLKLLRSILKTHKSRLDSETVGSYLKALKDNWKDGWVTRQLRNSYVGSRGWKDFHRDLVGAIRQVYPDFEE